MNGTLKLLRNSVRNADSNHTSDQDDSNGILYIDSYGHYEQYLIEVLGDEPDLSSSTMSYLIHPEGIKYYYYRHIRFLVDVPGIVYFYDWETIAPRILGWALIENFGSKNREWLSKRLIEAKRVRDIDPKIEETSKPEETDTNKETNKSEETDTNRESDVILTRVGRERNLNGMTRQNKKKSNSLEEVLSTKSKLGELGLLTCSSVKDSIIGSAIDAELTRLRMRLEAISNDDQYENEEETTARTRSETKKNQYGTEEQTENQAETEEEIEIEEETIIRLREVITPDDDIIDL